MKKSVFGCVSFSKLRKRRIIERAHVINAKTHRQHSFRCTSHDTSTWHPMRVIIFCKTIGKKCFYCRHKRTRGATTYHDAPDSYTSFSSHSVSRYCKSIPCVSRSLITCSCHSNRTLTAWAYRLWRMESAAWFEAYCNYNKCTARVLIVQTWTQTRNHKE